MLNEDCLYISTANVFSNLAFITPEPEEKMIDDDNLFFSIRFCKFCKEKKGIMYMKISRKLLDYINSNVFDQDCSIEETGKEVLNIICGNVLSDMFSDKKSFKLSPPVKEDSIKINRKADVETKIFFPDGNVELFVYMEDM